MAYVDIYAAATDAAHVLRKQVAVAIQHASVDVMNESAATANHNQRVAWAMRAAGDPVAWAATMIWRVLENSVIAANPTEAVDGDVQFVVNGLVDAFAKMRT